MVVEVFLTERESGLSCIRSCRGWSRSSEDHEGPCSAGRTVY